MTRGSELLLYLLVGIPAAGLGLLLLLAGPVGWFLAAFLGIAALGVASVLRDDGTGGATDRVNCPHCGSRTPPDGSCDYCGDPL